MNAATVSRMRPAPWGWKRALIGAGIGFALFLATSALVAILIAVVGSEPITSDVGDTFEIAGRIAHYTDQRLAAIAAGEDIPKPPLLKADTTTLRIAFIVTPIYQVGLIVFVFFMSGRTAAELVDDLGLNRFDFQTIWMAAIMLVATYAGVILYASAMSAFGPDVLVPNSTVPSSVTRDLSGLRPHRICRRHPRPAFRRALLPRLPLQRVASSRFLARRGHHCILFALTHFDPGSIIPFWGVGMALAWLAWRRGSLWDSIALHFMFNGTSFLLLLLTEV